MNFDYNTDTIMPKKIKLEIKQSKKKCHVPHRSGSGVHDSREKRLRTRANINRKEIEKQ